MSIKTTINVGGAEVPSPIYSLAYRIGEGSPEAVEIVMEQIGQIDLYWEWISAKRDADRLALAETPQGEGFFGSLAPASKQLADANSRQHFAWQKIQALIDVAREHIESLGCDGAPS